MGQRLGEGQLDGYTSPYLGCFASLTAALVVLHDARCSEPQETAAR